MVELTKAKAEIIARRYCPRCKLEVRKGTGGVIAYKGGNKYMDIVMSNDWFEKDGLISVCLSSQMGDGSICIKLNPKTLDPVNGPGKK